MEVNSAKLATMPQGFIEGFSETVQWKIPNFLSRRLRKYIASPRFSLLGCTWHLGVKMEPNGCVVMYLSKDCPNIAERTVRFIPGIKTKDGIVREFTDDHTFCEDNEYTGWPLFWRLSDLEECKSQLAPTGTLTLTCRIEDKEPTPEELAITFMTRDHKLQFEELKTLSSDFKDLLISEENCDVILNVQGKEFRAHRTVLSARSPVFRSMYAHDTAEAKSGIVKIPDCDPESFGDFLNFLYTGKTEEVSFSTALNLYATAEKYDVQQLKAFCANCLTFSMSERTVSDLVVLADRYGDDAMMTKAQTFFNKNFCKIILTPEWTALTLKEKPRLADKVMKEMASAVFKSS